MTCLEYCGDVLAYEQPPLYSGTGWEMIWIISFAIPVMEEEVTVDLTLEVQLPSFSM